MNKLVLFDIDKTLIEGSKGHREAFSYAFKQVYGVETGIDFINPEGMTDQQIIIEVLKKKGLREQVILAKISECMETMSDFFKRSIETNEVTLLPGVNELLKELKRQGVLMGLVTGNLESIARGKLYKAGINSYFEVGGFGSDHKDRAELVRMATKQAEEIFGFLKDNNVYLVGDTPRDIKAGKEAGVLTIGVATGPYSKEQLMEAGANFALENLNDKSRISEILGLADQGLERKN